MDWTLIAQWVGPSVSIILAGGALAVAYGAMRRADQEQDKSIALLQSRMDRTLSMVDHEDCERMRRDCQDVVCKKIDEQKKDVHEISMKLEFSGMSLARLEASVKAMKESFEKQTSSLVSTIKETSKSTEQINERLSRMEGKMEERKHDLNNK